MTSFTEELTGLSAGQSIEIEREITVSAENVREGRETRSDSGLGST